MTTANRGWEEGKKREGGGGGGVRKNTKRQTKLLPRNSLCEQFSKLRGEFLPDASACAAEQTASLLR